MRHTYSSQSKNTRNIIGIFCIILLIILITIILLTILFLFVNIFIKRTNQPKKIRERFSDNQKIMVVICTNLSEDSRLQLLKDSLLNAGFTNEEIIVLIPEGNFSWAKRLDEWKKYYNTCSPDTIILSLDAFDVIALKDIRNEIIDKFKNSGNQVLFGSNYYCWPNHCPTCINKEGAENFLCAGTYIGYANTLTDILNNTPWDADVDDQCYFATFMKSDKNVNNMIGLDTQYNIFQTTAINAPFEQIESKPGRVKNNQTGTEPCILHYDASHLNYDQLKDHASNTLHVI
jgi:hypothetical protein